MVMEKISEGGPTGIIEETDKQFIHYATKLECKFVSIARSA